MLGTFPCGAAHNVPARVGGNVELPYMVGVMYLVINLEKRIIRAHNNDVRTYPPLCGLSVRGNGAKRINAAANNLA